MKLHKNESAVPSKINVKNSFKILNLLFEIKVKHDYDYFIGFLPKRSKIEQEKPLFHFFLGLTCWFGFFFVSVLLSLSLLIVEYTAHIVQLFGAGVAYK